MASPLRLGDLMLAEAAGKGECHLRGISASAATDLHRAAFPIEELKSEKAAR
jgi:hypothetical protein